MGIRFNTNTGALTAQRSLALTGRHLQANYQRLSTGLRIVSAADDAAGLAISERMRAQLRSTQQALRNAQDGVSMVQTGEGALNEVSNILIRMRELSIQSATGSVSNTDRETIDREFQALTSELDRIARSTTFAGVNLLDGTGSTITFQIGPGTRPGVDTIQISTANTLATTLSLGSLDIGSGGDTSLAISTVDDAINTISRIRGAFGAVQNRLNSTVANLRTQLEPLTASQSRIRDVDVAAETAEMTRNTILQQAAVSVLAQANVQPQLALQLLGG